jgi:hypothetical protein
MGFDIIKRYKRLKEFFEDQDLQQEAAWIKLRLKRVRPNTLDHRKDAEDAKRR